MINDWENATSPSFSSGYNEVEMKQMIDQIWTFINCLYVLGQFIGGFSAKFVLEYLGRKRGFLFHNFFCILASTLVIIAPYVNSPVCVMISRFIFGIQSGIYSIVVLIDVVSVLI
jgi:MFS family permease